jgi:hypothetical protein
MTFTTSPTGAGEGRISCNIFGRVDANVTTIITFIHWRKKNYLSGLNRPVLEWNGKQSQRRSLMQVKLLPENLIVAAYPVLSSYEYLLVKNSDPERIKTIKAVWEWRPAGTYEIILVEDYEQKFVRRF